MNKKIIIGFILSNKAFPDLLNNIQKFNPDEAAKIENELLCQFTPRKIIGFNILNLPDFTQEQVEYDSIKNLSETELNDIGITMFYNIKEAYIMPTQPSSYINDKHRTHDINLHLVLCNKTNTFKLSKIPKNIGVYQDKDKNPIWFSTYTDKIFSSHNIRNPEDYKNKTQIVTITNLISHLEINILPNIGAYISVPHNHPQVLWSNIDSKPYNIYDKKYGKPHYNEFHSVIKTYIKLPFKVRPIMDNLIKITDDFIIINNNILLRLDSKNKDELIIPKCDTFIAFGTTLSYYKKVYFPKNIKSIITRVNYEDRDEYKNTVLYFDKETLKSRCINYMLYDNIKDYYSKYVYDQSYVNISDNFQNAIFLKDAIKALGNTYVEIKFI